MDLGNSIAEQGYAIVPEVLGRAEVVRLLTDLDKAGLRRSRAGLRHAMRVEAVASVAKDERMLGIARRVLGDGAFPFRGTLFDKSPTANWLVVWHQDTALPLRERRETPGWGPWSLKDGVTYAHAPASALEEVLALRLHLDDSTGENGPLRVLPGTHTLGVLTDQQIHDLSIKVAEVECVVARCAVLAMRPLIVHASSKSQAENPRRVLHIEYASTKAFGGGVTLATAEWSRPG